MPPTVGSRFDNSLDPAITEEQLTKVKDALKFDGAENVEVNLKSATLRITIDLDDKAGSSKVKSVLNDAYDKVVKILPVKTYFTLSSARNKKQANKLLEEQKKDK